jgi:hypothetical protein
MSTKSAGALSSGVSAENLLKAQRGGSVPGRVSANPLLMLGLPKGSLEESTKKPVPPIAGWNKSTTSSRSLQAVDRLDPETRWALSCCAPR